MSVVDNNKAYIQRQINSLLKDLAITSDKLFKDVENAINQLASKNGIIIDDGIGITEKLTKIIERGIVETGYNVKVVDFVKKYDILNQKVIAINSEYGTKVSESVVNRLAQNSNFTNKRLIADSIIGNGFKTNIIDLLTKEIYNAISNQVSVSELQGKVSNILNPENGYLSRWSGQVARDSMYQYEGALNNEIGKELKLNNFIVTPDIILEDSRPICRHIVAMDKVSSQQMQVILNEYCPNGVPSKQKIEINGKMVNKGAGMIEGTVLENISVKRGGYACIHQYIRVN